LCEGISLVSLIEQTTRKDAANLLMKAGFSSYMGALVSEYIETGDTIADLLRKKKLKRFETAYNEN
jgi:hypothetical protein